MEERQRERRENIEWRRQRDRETEKQRDRETREEKEGGTEREGQRREMKERTGKFGLDSVERFKGERERKKYGEKNWKRDIDGKKGRAKSQY